MPDTVTAFRGNEAKRTRLASLLTNETHQEAVEIILRSVTPRIGKSPTVESLAFQQAFSAGVVRAFESLAALSLPLPEQADDEAPMPFAGYVGGTLLSPDEIESKVARRTSKPKKQP